MNRRRERRPEGLDARDRSAGSVRRRDDRRTAPRIEGLEDRRLLTFGLKWAVGVGGGDVVANASRVDSAGDIYVAGTFSGTVNFNPNGNTPLSSQGGRDAFVAKYNSSGALLWARDFGGAGGDIANALAVDSAGDVYVGGYFQGNATFGGVSLAGGNTASFVAKLDANGNVAWADAGTSPTWASVAGLAVDSAGDVYAVGKFTGSANFGGAGVNAPSSSYYNGFLVKYTPSGAVSYATGFGGASYTQAFSVAVDSAGDAVVGGTNYYATTIGSTLPYGGGYDGFVAEFNASGSVSWARDLGSSGTDIIEGVAVDGSGNVYATGQFAGTATLGTASVTSVGAENVAVAKLDGAGNVAWLKSFGGTGSDVGTAVAVDSTGTVTVGGNFTGGMTLPGSVGTLTSAGSSDAFALRLDGSGNANWAQSFGGAGGDGTAGLSIDGNGNVDLVGTYAGSAIFGTSVLPSVGSTEYYVAQLGQSNAAVPVSPVTAFGLGGTSIQATSTRVDAAGDTFVAGTFSGTQQFDPTGNAAAVTAHGSTDAYVAKYSPGGALDWVADLGGAGAASASGLAVDSQGNVAVAGMYSGTLTAGGTTLSSVGGGNDAFVARLNGSGGVLWAASAGGAGVDMANAVAVDASGDVYVTGRFTGSATVAGRSISAPSSSYYNGFVAEYTAAGAPVYATAFGGPSYTQGMSIAVDAAGDAYVGGTNYYAATIGSTTLPYGGGYDGFVAKFAPGGAASWAQGVGGSGTDMVRGVAVDGAGNVYITGEYGNGAVVGGTTLTGSGAENIFAAEFSGAGGLAWAKGFGTTGTNIGNAIAYDPTGGVVVAGEYQGTIAFKPGSAASTLTSAGNVDAFVLRLDTSGNTTSAVGLGGVGADAATGVDVSSTGNITAVGSYVGPALFGGSTLQSHGTTNAFVAQVNGSSTKAMASAAVAPAPSAVTPSSTSTTTTTTAATPLVASQPTYQWKSWTPTYTDEALRQLTRPNG